MLKNIEVEGALIAERSGELALDVARRGKRHGGRKRVE